jgi:hypothetical protein
MNAEHFQNQVSQTDPNVDRSNAAFAAAAELIESEPLLANNARVREIQENNFIVNNKPLDPGNFLAAMLDHIRKKQIITPEEISRSAERLAEVMVDHSLPPTLEHQIENRPQ